MNFKSQLSVISGVIALSLVAFGAQANQGVVNFEGSVVNSPCGIAPESLDQTVDFGQISKQNLENNARITKQFKIELTGCDTTALTGKTVSTTFIGGTIPGAPTELGTTGGTGTAITITTPDGSDVTFGTPGAGQIIGDGNNTLLYSASVHTGTGLTVAEGDFTAVSNFTLTYQ